jgi:hypothetical protein
MEDHYPRLGRPYQISDIITVAGEGGEYDEVDNEFYAEDALENRVRVSPSVLKTRTTREFEVTQF